MGNMQEFSLPIRLFLKAYRWKKIEPVPFTPLKKPLAESKISLVSTAGFVLPNQEPFDENIKGGDFSLREIPSDSDVTTFTEYHKSESFNHEGVLADSNLAFPIDRINELVEQKRIASVAQKHYSLMGSITAPGRLIKETIPKIVDSMLAENVDVALLVPV